jgi:MoaA/NifB/PqqE/SkfB family radical SAM enzyme|tara:strand:+ start:154 stop:618 length:465 start_codon:yes stop_codon:yes gene_type:complete
MKTKILKNNLFGGVYTDEFLKKNKDNIINGSLVSTWNLTDAQCSTDIILPIFENGFWIESATNEEILELNNKKFKIKRNSLLKKGVVVELNNVEYWFNEKSLSNFIGFINVSDKANYLSIKWKTKGKVWNTLSISDAYQITFSASQKIQEIYTN